MMENFLKNKDVIQALKMISPGTPLRQGLDNVLKAKTGGLIVLAINEETMKVVDGGFTINADYSPSYLYELAKMDGAIVISGDTKKILVANAQLIPEYTIPTTETGMFTVSAPLGRISFNCTRLDPSIMISPIGSLMVSSPFIMDWVVVGFVMVILILPFVPTSRSPATSEITGFITS